MEYIRNHHNGNGLLIVCQNASPRFSLMVRNDHMVYIQIDTLKRPTDCLTKCVLDMHKCLIKIYDIHQTTTLEGSVNCLTWSLIK